MRSRNSRSAKRNTKKLKPNGFKSKVGAALAAFMMATTFMLGLGVTPASAAGSGCTLAQGGLGAQNCVTTSGSGLTVTASNSIYNSGVNPTNVCNPNSKWKHKPNGSSAYSYKSISATTCGLTRAYIKWSNPGTKADGSQFCATQKNSVISSYANYACLNIKK